MERLDVSIKPKFGLSLRRTSGIVLLAFAAAASSIMLPGCVSAPTVPEIRKSYRERLKDLDDWFFDQLVV